MSRESQKQQLSQTNKDKRNIATVDFTIRESSLTDSRSAPRTSEYSDNIPFSQSADCFQRIFTMLPNVTNPRSGRVLSMFHHTKEDIGTTEEHGADRNPDRARPKTNEAKRDGTPGHSSESHSPLQNPIWAHTTRENITDTNMKLHKDIINMTCSHPLHAEDLGKWSVIFLARNLNLELKEYPQGLSRRICGLPMDLASLFPEVHATGYRILSFVLTWRFGKAEAVCPGATYVGDGATSRTFGVGWMIFEVDSRI